MAFDRLWWFTPFQVATTVVASANFGASALQSPLTWPMLQMPDIPVQYVGIQTENVLHGSEFIFPPMNAFCTLGNIIMSGYAYYNPESPTSAKLPLTALAAGLHIATTVYTLSVMAPYNRKLVALSKELNKGVEKGDENSETQRRTASAFRETQQTWKQLNYGRGLIMLSASLANAVAVTTWML